MITVELSEAELSYAIHVGTRRYNENEAAGNPDGKVLRDGLFIDQIGAVGEYAAAKGLGILWEGKYFDDSLNQKKFYNDLQYGIEVRSRLKDHYGLLVRRNEAGKHLDSPYVLVLVENRRRPKLAGWLYGREAQRKEYWREECPRPCWIVPQGHLRRTEDLKNMIAKRDMEVITNDE